MKLTKLQKIAKTAERLYAVRTTEHTGYITEGHFAVRLDWFVIIQVAAKRDYEFAQSLQNLPINHSASSVQNGKKLTNTTVEENLITNLLPEIANAVHPVIDRKLICRIDDDFAGLFTIGGSLAALKLEYTDLIADFGICTDAISSGEPGSMIVAWDSNGYVEALVMPCKAPNEEIKHSARQVSEAA